MKFEKLLQLNKLFEENCGNGLDESDANFQKFNLRDNKSKIIISAPHAVNHLRDKELLKADALTGGLALYCSEFFNLSAIYTKSSLAGDPNFDSVETSEYKMALLNYIKNNDLRLLIDLHGCWSERDFAIELGTGGDSHPNLLGNKKILKIVQNSLTTSLYPYLQHTGRKITVNSIFPASNKNTISSFIAINAHLPTIQLEINYDLRDINNKENITRLINALECLISDLNEYFGLINRN